MVILEFINFLTSMKKCNTAEEKCDKCDDRGMITEVKNGAHYGHSCECGYANYLMEHRFKEVSIEELLSYGAERIEDKKQYIQGKPFKPYMPGPAGIPE